MDFLTLHDLARQFNKPERVIRYKFHSLRQSGKLVEKEDFRREDFVVELHFAYRINPLRFMEESRLALVSEPASRSVVGLLPKPAFREIILNVEPKNGVTIFDPSKNRQKKPVAPQILRD